MTTLVKRSDVKIQLVLDAEGKVLSSILTKGKLTEESTPKLGWIFQFV